MFKNKKKVHIILVIIFISLIIGYGYGVVYFTKYSYPKTIINGRNQGMKSVEDILSINKKDDKLIVEGRNNKKLIIDYKDIDYIGRFDKKFNIKQNAYLWPIEIFKTHLYNVQIDYTYNEKKLKNLVYKSEILKNIIEPKNAKIVNKDNKYIIEKEVLGDKINKDVLFNLVDNAVKKSKKKIVLEKEYIKPTVFKDNKDLKESVEKLNKLLSSSNYAFNFDDNKDYIENVEKLNKLLSLKYTFKFGDNEYVLEGTKLLNLFDMDNNNFVINEDKLKNYVSNIASKINTYKSDHLFHATDIGDIIVSGGIYGWSLDVSSTVDNLRQLISEYKSGDVELVFDSTAKVEGKRDIGNTYIEVDISRQHIWYYKNGSLVIDTPVVTGDLKTGTITYKGVYEILEKDENANLYGTNVDGTPYKFPVSYWMLIDGDSAIGIHDSYVRNYFGGNIYTYEGSHGCINTPIQNLRVIYNNVEMHTPVVIYESGLTSNVVEIKSEWQIKKDKESEKETKSNNKAKENDNKNNSNSSR